MTNHSPLPYHTGVEGRHITIEIPGQIVARLEMETSIPTEKEFADAEFIVNACNNHYELLHALVDLIHVFSLRVENDPDKHIELMRAQSAVVRAEGGAK